MSGGVPRAPAVIAKDLRKLFAREHEAPAVALDSVSLEAAHGELTALVGPDGAGKTTLMRLAAGLLRADGGSIEVLGIDAGTEPQQIQDRISYMPQRFGLYEDLTVAENLELYANLHGVSEEERARRYPQLMAMTALGPFKTRLAGQLSGGMKQKLGLACTLVREPDLLLLDEPTVGVDPLSRRELWEIVHGLVTDQGLTVLLSTAYLDEAERCSRVIMLHQGRVLSQGSPQQVAALASGRSFVVVPSVGQSARMLQARLLDRPDIVDAVPDGGRVRFVRGSSDSRRPGAPGVDTSGVDTLRDLAVAAVPPRFEDGFMILLQGATESEHAKGIAIAHPLVRHEGEAVVRVEQLVKKFGSFTAVDHINFEVGRGQIFGLLGPNGAGKTTTFRMLCGLLVPSSGQLHVAGANVRGASASARARIGYVAQKFSLYGPLSVTENLEFFASAYGLRGERKQSRIDWAMEQFELGAHARATSSTLPGGYKQRLAMAAALLHEPEILFLDEPTSGADPRARRAFWRRITALAEQGVTIIVTTHFMQEAEYCDRVAIMDSGKILAQGSPAEVRALARSEKSENPSMDDAFIAVVEKSREHLNGAAAAAPAAARPDGARSMMINPPRRSDASNPRRAKLRRIRALVLKETRQIVRDPSSIAIGVVLPLILILLFGYGLSLDVKNVPIAVVIESSTPEAVELAAGFQLSPYFHPWMTRSMPPAQEQLLEHRVDGILRIPADFSRHVAAGDADVQLIVHGGDANRARIIEGYAQGVVGIWAARLTAEGRASPGRAVSVQSRLWFNEANDSSYFLVPGLVVLVMTLIGGLLTAMVMAREWERGTLESLLVTPVRTDEILLGKTLPYFVLALFGFALCVLSAKFLFHVPLRGSIWVLLGASMLYVLVALGIGLLISSWVKNQLVASQLTMLATFMPAFMLSGFLFDLRSMPPVVRLITYALPARYYVALLQTVFLAGDVWSVILPNTLMLAVMAGALALGSRAVLQKTLS